MLYIHNAIGLLPHSPYNLEGVVAADSQAHVPFVSISPHVLEL